MKKYYYVSIINDTTNIYITSKEEAEKQLHKNNFISFIAHGNKVIVTRGITFENAQKELNEIIEVLHEVQQ